MIQNRDYQEECIDVIWNEFFKEDDVLVQLPTASGKTIIFSLLLKRAIDTMRGADRDFKAMVLVNKVKLVTQTEDKLSRIIDSEDIALNCGSLNKYNTGEVTVASIQTVKKGSFDLNLLIIDEAHNADKSKSYKDFIHRCKEINPKLKIARFTATPFTNTGYIFGDGKPNKRIVFKRTLQQQVDAGWIVPPIFKTSDKAFDTSGLKVRGGDFIEKDLVELTKDEEKILQQVKDALPRLRERSKIVWACTCIEHAERLAKLIGLYEPCAIIHSKMSKAEQKLNIDEFEQGYTKHLASVMIVSEGYDYEPLDAVVIMRPTRSPVLYVQLIGRGLRLSKDKKDCLVLDYGEVVQNLGHPDKLSITKKEKKSGEKRALICPACEEITFMPANKCSNKECRHEFFKEPVKVDRLKNLSVTTASNKFNKKNLREDTVKVLDWSIEDYTSRAGNDCIKVTYYCLMNTYTEFIKKGTWFEKEFNRLYEGMNKQPPTKIDIELRGKFVNVKKRYYT